MMNILVVDNNQEDMRQTLKTLKAVYPYASLIPFDDAMAAVQYGLNHEVDAVYTEAMMPRISGFDVVRLIQKFRPNSAAYLVSKTNHYTQQAMQQGLCGYYLKPLLENTLQTGNLLKQEIVHA